MTGENTERAMPSQLVAHKPHRASADLCYAGVSLTVRGLVTYPENRVEFSADCVEAGEGIDNILPLLGEDVIDELNTMAAVQLLYERGVDRVADQMIGEFDAIADYINAKEARCDS